MKERKISPCEDADLLAKLYQSVQEVHHQLIPNVFKSFDYEAFRDLLQDLLAAETHHFFIAWQKQPCGFIHLKEIELSDTPLMVSQRRLEIEALSVENAYQKQGVGEALLTHAADFAREKQFATLTLNFWAKNQVADFYQRNGFQVERYRASKIL